MADFFCISVRKHFPDGHKQLKALGKTLDMRCKANWAAPLRENVVKLRDISNNIPSIIRTHHKEIAQGNGLGYFRSTVCGGDSDSVSLST